MLAASEPRSGMLLSVRHQAISSCGIPELSFHASSPLNALFDSSIDLSIA